MSVSPLQVTGCALSLALHATWSRRGPVLQHDAPTHNWQHTSGNENAKASQDPRLCQLGHSCRHMHMSWNCTHLLYSRDSAAKTLRCLIRCVSPSRLQSHSSHPQPSTASSRMALSLGGCTASLSLDHEAVLQIPQPAANCVLPVHMLSCCLWGC